MSELDLYERLKAIAAAQVVAVEADDLERFGRLSDEREALQARLGTPSNATAARVLREVLVLDARAQRSLRTSLDTTRGELSQLRQGHRAVRAYAPRLDTLGVGSQA